MRTALLAFIAIATATAQDQTGRIEGVVLDALSHQPLKKAAVSINFMGVPHPNQNAGPQKTTTDANGSFTFNSLYAGQYQVMVMHQNYPQPHNGAARKTVQVSAGDTATSVIMELIPGASVAGRVVDEDGDPLPGCIIQPHPAGNFNEGLPMMRIPRDGDEGTYRLYGIPPGKYIITAQCSASVFQPRPLSEGPDPPPSAAYPIQFYPAARDAKSAQIVELLPGTEKSGVDFQMRPVPVTSIHGTLATGSAEWRGRNDLQVQLVPLGRRASGSFGLDAGAQINAKDGSFELRQVFPGSYRLVAFSQDFSARTGPTDASNRIGAVMRVDVADKPIDLSIQLHRAMDVPGTIEIERSNSSTEIMPNQIGIQLTSESQFGPSPAFTEVHEDGTFTIKSVLPGEWRIQLVAPAAFLKSARLGGDNVTNGLLDLTSGSAAPLHIVVSANTATIRGTAPAGLVVFALSFDEDFPILGARGAKADSNGQFALGGLTPGKYRIVAGDMGVPPPEEGGQKVIVGEGETATIEIKAEPKP